MLCFVSLLTVSGLSILCCPFCFLKRFTPVLFTVLTLCAVFFNFVCHSCVSCYLSCLCLWIVHFVLPFSFLKRFTPMLLTFIALCCVICFLFLSSFCFLWLVLSVSLGCPFCVAPFVFSNVYSKAMWSIYVSVYFYAPDFSLSILQCAVLYKMDHFACILQPSVRHKRLYM